MKRKGDTIPTTFKKIHRVTQSDVTEFNWKTHCFYYGYPCVPDPRHPTRKKKAETFVHCLSNRMYWKRVTKEMING